jgi:hypothetical protein
MTTHLLTLPRVDLTVEVFTNEDWLDALAFYDNDGNPISLDGIAFELEVRTNPGDVTAFLEIDNATPGGGIVITGNQFQIDVPVAQISQISPGDYVFDATAKADGMQRVIITGTLTLTEGITR